MKFWRDEDRTWKVCDYTKVRERREDWGGMKRGNLAYDYVNSKFMDLSWFLVALSFVWILLLRLLILLYFGANNFVSFDLLKILGFQWYWVYFVAILDYSFSNLLCESDLLLGDLRLLQVNNSVVLFSLVFYKLWLSSLDVIHSFTLGSLGIKVDCVPGRSNEVGLCCYLPGTHYGQCSELCGVLHGFMPICFIFVC